MTPAEHKFHVPQMGLTRTTSSITFHFRPVDRKRHMGWAFCTVNEEIGLLSVCSDWGNWTYLWGHSGMPKSDYSFGQTEGLLEFLGFREPYIRNGIDISMDYVAMKLTSDGRSNGRDEAREFDPEKTCLRFKEELCRKRLEFGREPYFDRYHHDEPLSARLARDLWESLSGELSTTRDSQLFCERFMHLDGWNWIFEEPWEHLVHEPTTAFHVLREGILPALRDACTEVVKARRPAPPPIGWAGDLAQRDIERAAIKYNMRGAETRAVP